MIDDWWLWITIRIVYGSWKLIRLKNKAQFIRAIIGVLQIDNIKRGSLHPLLNDILPILVQIKLYQTKFWPFLYWKSVWNLPNKFPRGTAELAIIFTQEYFIILLLVFCYLCTAFGLILNFEYVPTKKLKIYLYI